MKILIITALLSTAFTAVANPFAKPSEAHGVLNLQQPHPSRNIFPVSVYQIDGKNIITRDTGLWLKPGLHTLRMSAVIPVDQLTHGSSRIVRSNSLGRKTLDVTVEDGKMYFIGYDASERNPKNWKPVVWKVKDL